ncbi:FKBP-type peptidyl-prolyl cis-trans isomerase [Pedobacter chitinilyticus]|nr:FKBP-type peptidyl-prolyl cis-trans isomerase [Pedobacter chitinilyticus]
MYKTFTYLVVLFMVLTLFTSCKKEYEKIEDIDETQIKNYISKNNLQNVKSDPSGFYYQITEPGTGDLFTNTDFVLYDVTVKSLMNGTQYLQSPTYANLGNYVGYLNSFFNSSLSTSIYYNIPAIRTAVLSLKPGGSARILLPSYLAFGKNGAGPIPSNEIIDLYIKTSAFRKQDELDDDKIIKFLAANQITAIKHSSGVYYQEITQGTGTDVIDEHSSLVVKYSGRFLDGTQFDSSDSYTAKLLEVVKGWGEVLPLFKKGSKVRIFIPSGLGYGTSGYGSVPPNAVLDFTIEITNVTNS